MYWFGRMEYIPKKSRYAKCLPLEQLCNSLCGPLPKNLASPSLYDLNDRQSQKRRRGCHCWELQDEPIAFCERNDTARVDLLNRAFSTHLIGFCCVRPSRNENQHKKVRSIVSIKTPKAVFSASERQFTAAGGDVQVPWGGIHEWPKSEQRDWYT